MSLKLKRRKTGAPDPPKFMGHGDCDNMSRSVTLPRFTDAASDLGAQGKALLRTLRVDPTQIRGIGLNVNTLTASNRTLTAPAFVLFRTSNNESHDKKEEKGVE